MTAPLESAGYAMIIMAVPVRAIAPASAAAALRARVGRKAATMLPAKGRIKAISSSQSSAMRRFGAPWEHHQRWSLALSQPIWLLLKRSDEHTSELQSLMRISY